MTEDSQDLSWEEERFQERQFLFFFAFFQKADFCAIFRFTLISIMPFR